MKLYLIHLWHRNISPNKQQKDNDSENHSEALTGLQKTRREPENEENDWLIQFSSAAQSCLTLCNPMSCSTPGLPIHHNSQSLPKPMSIESVMPSNHLILCHPFSSCPQFSQHQGLFQWVSSSHQVAKVLELQLQHQSFQWIFRTDLL